MTAVLITLGIVAPLGIGGWLGFLADRRSTRIDERKGR